MRFALDSGPHIKDGDGVSLVYKKLLLALIPVLLFSIYKNVFLVYIDNKDSIIEVIYPLLIIIVSCSTSYFTEKLYVWFDSLKNGYKKINIFNSVITGLYISMLLPINTPLYVVALGAFLAILFGKMLYGGFGENLFNPAAIGYIFIAILFGSVLSNPNNYFNLIEIGKYTSLPLSNLATFSYDKIVAPFGSLTNFIFGTVPGPLGTTNAFLILFSFSLLSIFKVVKWKITVTYIFTIFFMTLLIGLNHNAGLWFPLFNILSGSTLFVAVFMTDPVTTATTSTGQILNGMGLGILTVCIRFFMDTPDRIMLAILLMNLIVPSIDNIGMIARSNKKYKYIIILLAILLLVLVSFFISNRI